MTKRSRPRDGNRCSTDLTFVRQFLTDLVENTHPLHGLPETPHIWSRQDEGSMFPDPEVIEDYCKVKRQLFKTYSKNEDLSESALDSALRTAVFEAVDIPKRRGENLTLRVEAAVDNLRLFLESSPEQYEC